MTTLSKEDVVLLMEKSKFRSWIRGEGPSNEGFFMNFATIARADLVAENERLKATPPDQRQDLHCVVSDIAAECRELHDQLTAARTALAAAETRETKLRDELEKIACLGNGNMHGNSTVNCMAIDALAQPRDDSALREMIAGVCEECAQACKSFQWKHRAMVFNDELERCVCAIRALAEKAKGE